MTEPDAQARINMVVDLKYAPYCLRCSGLVRMRRISPVEAKCECGAIVKITGEFAKVANDRKRLLECESFVIQFLSLLDEDDPVEVGCYCTNDGTHNISCVWCRAKQFIESNSSDA